MDYQICCLRTFCESAIRLANNLFGLIKRRTETSDTEEGRLKNINDSKIGKRQAQKRLTQNKRGKGWERDKHRKWKVKHNNGENL